MWRIRTPSHNASGSRGGVACFSMVLKAASFLFILRASSFSRSRSLASAFSSSCRGTEENKIRKNCFRFLNKVSLGQLFCPLTDHFDKTSATHLKLIEGRSHTLLKASLIFPASSVAALLSELMIDPKSSKLVFTSTMKLLS